MHRALILAAIFFAGSHATSGQALGVLHIKIVVADAERKAMPVPRHMLLISDNPTSAPPRQVITALDGTASVKLRPGNYTVESDRPFVIHGKAYQWTQIVDIVAGRDLVLELTADNAEIEPASSATDSAASLDADPSYVLAQWHNSVVALWTPLTHASGFVIDARGLIATSQRAVAAASSVEVQFSPAVKVAASVLAADPERDVAVLRVHPNVAASVRPVPLGCAQTTKTPIVKGQKLFTIVAPLREEKGIASGTVTRVEPHAITSDLILASGSAGGPVFMAGGVVGLTSVVDHENESRRQPRIVPIEDACDVVASAERRMRDAEPPGATHLPVEPTRSFPVTALKDAARRRAGSMNPYQMSSSDFDIAFITPVHMYGTQYQSELARGRERRTNPRSREAEVVVVQPLMDFGNWSEYFADVPPVLLVRVTPKAVEGFWTTVARGAARTQGVGLPPIKHVKSSFSRMRAFCGETEVTAVHPFKLERPVSENATVYEGLYVFDPDALGPHCGPVKLVLYSEKEPDNGDSRVVEGTVVQQIWRDFEPYRADARRP
jgi:S1-C subfamily serine protease